MIPDAYKPYFVKALMTHQGPWGGPLRLLPYSCALCKFTAPISAIKYFDPVYENNSAPDAPYCPKCVNPSNPYFRYLLLDEDWNTDAMTCQHWLEVRKVKAYCREASGLGDKYHCKRCYRYGLDQEGYCPHCAAASIKVQAITDNWRYRVLYNSFTLRGDIQEENMKSLYQFYFFDDEDVRVDGGEPQNVVARNEKRALLIAEVPFGATKYICKHIGNIEPLEGDDE